MLALLALALLVGLLAPLPAAADPLPQAGPDSVEHGGRRGGGGSNSGAGGN